ncbi:MAG: MFS transporter [Provencibacterium sp.]|jgi:DHA3 family macrolide efflux protein-like MFS transporter|nr:MFS transporter [Provencibacterium sp.]
MKKRNYERKDFYILWSTQSLSQLGSTMTNFSLTLWLYQATGSALQTALLSVCSYAPYVLMSIFAGALSDRWDKKRTMLVCDTLAACCTVAVFVGLKLDLLSAWHLYLLNALNGLMNTVQSPAGDVVITLITPKKSYQKASSLRSFSSSLITILHPVLATSFYALGGMDIVILVDLVTFAAAFFALLLFVKIPQAGASVEASRETLLEAAKGGLKCLNENRMVLALILFLAGVNLVASAFDAVLPAFVLPRENGGEAVLGVVTSFAGIAMLAGSLTASVLPAPKDRIRLIVFTMLFSLTADNFLMSLTRTPAAWCIAQILGYFPVPLMNTSLDVIVRSTIPTEMQGRVYSCRNSLQFFTIPIGYFFGGWMVDVVCEPFMAKAGGMAVTLFGQGKGSGAAIMIFILGFIGMTVCLIFGRVLKKYRYEEAI